MFSLGHLQKIISDNCLTSHQPKGPIEWGKNLGNERNLGCKQSVSISLRIKKSTHLFATGNVLSKALWFSPLADLEVLGKQEV